MLVGEWRVKIAGLKRWIGNFKCGRVGRGEWNGRLCPTAIKCSKFKLEDERWEFVMQLCLPLPNGFVNDFFSKIKTEAKSQDELWPMR